MGVKLKKRKYQAAPRKPKVTDSGVRYANLPAIDRMMDMEKKTTLSKHARTSSEQLGINLGYETEFMGGVRGKVKPWILDQSHVAGILKDKHLTTRKKGKYLPTIKKLDAYRYTEGPDDPIPKITRSHKEHYDRVAGFYSPHTGDATYVTGESPLWMKRGKFFGHETEAKDLPKWAERKAGSTVETILHELGGHKVSHYLGQKHRKMEGLPYVERKRGQDHGDLTSIVKYKKTGAGPIFGPDPLYKKNVSNVVLKEAQSEAKYKRRVFRSPSIRGDQAQQRRYKEYQDASSAELARYGPTYTDESGNVKHYGIEDPSKFVDKSEELTKSVKKINALTNMRRILQKNTLIKPIVTARKINWGT